VELKLVWPSPGKLKVPLLIYCYATFCSACGFISTFLLGRVSNRITVQKLVVR